ncbi:MAG: tetratricopeptide repeat protein, partial [Geminicoccaceae bacterium]
SVCDDVGFRLYLATYDQPKRRDELIGRVVREAEAEKVRVTRLDLAEAGPTNLVGLLRAHLQETDLPPGWRQAVMVTGIEQRLDYSAGPEGFAFLHQANLLRDALPEAAPVPVVLWLSRMASAVLPVEAPDLWHWRTANFDFTGDEAPRLELLRELTTLRPEDDLRLSGEQRRARIRMLEDLLAELEHEGSPKSKRQAAERAHLLLDLGTEDWRLGRAADALPRLERALEAFREIGDLHGEGAALGNLGNAYAALGELRQAIEHHQRALIISREIGDRRAEGQDLGNLGNAYAALGKPQLAIEHYQQRLAIAREIGDPQGEGQALGNLGLAYADLGELRRAIEHHEQQLAIARKIGDRRGEGAALGNLGGAHFRLGELQRAIEHHEQDLAIAREIGDRRGEGQAFGNLGNAYYSLGELGRAIEHYEQDLVIAREIGDRQGEGQALYNSALAFDQLGERDGAIRRMDEALRIFERIESPAQEKARAKLAAWRGGAGEG